MRELKYSTAHLARQTGLSETTVRYLGQSLSGHNKSSLVALSAVLRWRYDHLTNILRREPEKTVHIKRRIEDTRQRLIHDEFAPVKEQLRELTEQVHRVADRLDTLTKQLNRQKEEPWPPPLTAVK